MAAATAADLVVLGDVYTVDAARRWAQAVAIKGDRIVAVGTEDDVRDRVGEAADVISGSMILPGIQDAHVHPSVAGRNLLNVDLSDLTDAGAYLDRISTFASEHPDLPWILGGGWYGPVFAATDGPRKEDLDAVVPDRPVFLLNTDVHGAWVNSKALELAGLSASPPDPWDGYLVRNADGTPTGCLQEGAAYDLLRGLIPSPDAGEWMECLRVAQRHLHSLGITGWQDAWVEPELLRAYRELDDEGELTARVVTSLWWDRHRGLEQIDGLRAMRGSGAGGRVDTGTVKIMLDGCPENGTGAMLAPYEGRAGDEHGTGIQFVDAEVLNEAVPALDALGFQVHQHALGDRAIRSALDAIEAARAANGPNDLRHHVAHLQFPDPSDVPRLRALNVVANVQPYWAQPDPAIEQLVKPRVGERVERLYPIADLKRSGAVLAFGSDWPVSTPDPFRQMEVAVTRRAPGDMDGPALDETQRIELRDAIVAFTGGSAYVNRDDDAGSIEEGKRADMVLLDRNLFDGSSGPIHRTEVVATIASGRVVYQR